MNASPKTSIIIVSFNTREILRDCIARLFEVSRGLDIEVIVVDNNSRDASADMVERDFPAVRLIRSAINLGFAAANNLGFGQVTGEFILLLNPDALLEPEALQRALRHMSSDPSIGIGGGRLLDRAGSMQPSARLYPSLLNEVLVLSGLAARFPKSRFFGRFDRTWDVSGRASRVDWIPGAFALIRKSALDAVGAFDERFFLYYEEVDLCLRFRRAGWDIWYWPDVVVRHWGGESSKTVKDVEFSSSGSQLTLWRMRSALLYYRKHHGVLTTSLVALLEAAWHQLRGLRARLLGNTRKYHESSRIVTLMQRAWLETGCGRVSPPRPW
jgi:GT2 family glycosyltransferase